MSEHARLIAWKTRRAKYGPKGHVGSYSRRIGAHPCEDCRGLLDLVIRLHREGVLSEGQVSRASGLDRVTVRALVCDQTDACGGKGGWERDSATVPATPDDNGA
jgi:hypothetical protein